ncbi:MAG: hypothetical protein OCC49_15550 [Fibrobacterales bacterium]
MLRVILPLVCAGMVYAQSASPSVTFDNGQNQNTTANTEVPTLPKFEPGFATQQDLEKVAQFIAEHPETYSDATAAKNAFVEAGITDLAAAKLAYIKFREAYDKMQAKKEREEKRIAAAQKQSSNSYDPYAPNKSVAEPLSSSSVSTERQSSATQVPVIAQTGDNTEGTPAPSSSASETVAETPTAAEGTENATAEPEKESQPGFSFSNNLSMAFVTTEDGFEQPRISWMPEIGIGNFGIKFDISFFLRNGSPSKQGWEYDNNTKRIHTIYDKIYYIRYNQPGDMFYIKAGAIEGITMDPAGLLTSNWGNVAQYPGKKLLGIHLQLNKLLGPVSLNVEAATSSVEEWQNSGGGVLASRASFTPLGFLSVPIIKDFRLGGTFVGDFDQYAGLKDSDQDGCPNKVDDQDEDASVCIQHPNSIKENILFPEYWSDILKDQFVDEYKAKDTRQSDSLKGEFAEDQFRLIAFDAFLPVLSTSILSLDLYSEFASTFWAEDQAFSQNYGIVPLGSRLHFGIIDFGLEYRFFHGSFNAGHFDSNYEIQRVRQNDETNQFETKETTYWSEDLGKRHGIFGSVDVDLGVVAILGGNYQHLISDKKGEKHDRSYRAHLSLGESITQFIPKVQSASIFFQKKRVGQDKGHDGTWPRDGFIQLSQYTSWGYQMGFDMNGMNLQVSSTFTYKYEGAVLVSENQFRAETLISF